MTWLIRGRLFSGLLIGGFLSMLTVITAVSASAEKIDCLQCHKELSEGKVVHPAIQMGCENCHSGVDASDIPHKFSGRKGLASEPPELCFNCHGKEDFSKKIKHQPVSAGQCLSCHLPHSGPNRFLLIKDGNQLCLTCHPEIRQKPHIKSGPLPEGHQLSGRRDPNREGMPFGCISCHVPHSSDWGKLFRYEAQKPSDLCKHCHEFMG